VEPKWDRLLDTRATFQQLFFLKARVGFGMHAVLEACPVLGPQDLIIVHRQTPKGQWKGEVWTKRRFAARELLVPCVATELRECLWSKIFSAFVGLPSHGPGKHPEGKSLALDGRHRGVIASAGNVGDTEVRGALYWAIERASDANDANLEVEQVHWGTTTEVRLPGGKKRKVDVVSDSGDLPGIPVLVNPKIIEAHTRLFARLEVIPGGDAKPAAKPKTT